MYTVPQPRAARVHGYAYRPPEYTVPPEAQGSLPGEASLLYARRAVPYQPRACRSYRVPWHHPCTG